MSQGKGYFCFMTRIEVLTHAEFPHICVLHPHWFSVNHTNTPCYQTNITESLTCSS